MRILGIETSCDETAIAIVNNGKTIISNSIYSQVDIHKKFNGVVPEIASRNHLIKILDVLDNALKGESMSSIDAIAVTNGPGLIGALLIGLSTAKALAYTHKLPLVPVNHIMAHLYAPHLFHDIEFPYIGLVVSGGHTILFEVKSFDDIKLLGSTIDDAIGEAFDKVAKLLGLGYPGGPAIDKIAKDGDAKFLDLPRGLKDNEQDRFNFSYSGLKSAVAYRLKDILPDGQKPTPKIVSGVAASFQRVAVDMLYRKASNALQYTNCKRLVISGGVAANSYLRKKFDEMQNDGVSIYTAPLEYCSDNGAMVAGRGFVNYLAGKFGDFTTDAYSRLPYIKKGKRVVVGG